MKKFLVLVAGFVFISAASAAPTGAFMQRVQDRFNAANTNHDGKLTLAEAQAGMPRVAQHFAEIDTAKKGYITFSQLSAFMAAKK
ncbi:MULTISPECIES: EF-hand domain-containing protein [Pantoea]|uniref:Calcium-binding protein n=1 Tax=Pantoea cypripedii TaxID=55209 RepID=A0A1X1ELD4_PANCY|nr:MULTISPECIES: EF-hand domain-containing protein [Pantoea]MBP2200170.1 Ca2+-binding EF-hand superfamily protein [Pantoea cypripedii]ORM89768.1 calcium-binding protein [Pantoea cypripedii]